MTSIEDPEFLANLFYRKCYWHADELATQARQDHRPAVREPDPTAWITAEVERLRAAQDLLQSARPDRLIPGAKKHATRGRSNRHEPGAS